MHPFPNTRNTSTFANSFMPSDHLHGNIPQQKTKLIHIDSRFATIGQEPNQYIFELPEPLTFVSRLVIEEVDFPISYYNVSARLGNNSAIFKLVDAETEYTIVVPDGYYTATSLASAFAEAVTTTISGFVSGFEMTAVVSSSSIISLSIVHDTDEVMYIHWGEPLPTNQMSHTLGHLLGFRDFQTAVTSGNITITGIVPCLPQFVMPYLFLAVDDYTNSSNSRVLVALGGVNSSAGGKGSAYLSSKSILAKITVPGTAQTYGDRVIATQSTGYMTAGVRCYESNTKIKKLKFTWIDVMGNVVELNSFPFSVCLRVDCV